LVGEAQLGKTPGKGGEGHLALESAQSGSQRKMRPAPEGDVLDLGARNVETVGLRESSRSTSSERVVDRIGGRLG